MPNHHAAFDRGDQPDVITFKPAYDITESCEQLSLSKPKLYQEINAGRLESFQIGRRRYISGRALARYIDAREAERSPSTLPRNQPNTNRDQKAASRKSE